MEPTLHLIKVVMGIPDAHSSHIAGTGHTGPSLIQPVFSLVPNGAKSVEIS